MSNSSGAGISPVLGADSSVSIFGSDADGNADFAKGASYRNVIEEGGNFSARLSPISAGKYWTLFSLGGSFDNPSFIGQPFWIDSNGAYSTSATGPFQPASQFVYEAIAPEPNLSIVAREQDSGVGLASYISLSEVPLGSQVAPYYGPDAVDNGTASYAVADGVYELWISPMTSQLVSTRFEVTIDLGVPTIETDLGDEVQPQADGSFVLELERPNLVVNAVSPLDPTVSIRNFAVEVLEEQESGERFVTSNGTGNGSVGLNVPDGDFILRLVIWDGSFANREFGLSVTNGVSEVTDLEADTVISPIGDVYQLAPHVPNITGTLKDASNVTLRQGDGFSVQIQLQKQIEGNNWSWSGYTNMQPDGTFGIRVVEAGTYRLQIRPNGRADLAETFSQTFNVTGPSYTNDLGDITLETPDVLVRIVEPGGTTGLRYVYGNIVNTSTNNYVGSFETGNSGLAGIKFPGAGVYSLDVNSPFNLPSSRVAGKSFTATVTEQDSSLSFAIDSLTPVNGVYTLELAVPNLTGVIKRPDGTAIDQNDGDWANINLQKYNQEFSSWEWSNKWADMARDGSFGLRVDEDGTYRLRIEPYNIDNASRTFSSQFTVSGGVATPSSFNNLQLAIPTAVLAVREPNSSINIRYTGIEIRKDGNWVDWLSTNQNGTANFSAQVDGNYEFVVHPSGQTSYNRKKYAGTVTTVAGVKSLTIDGVTAVNGLFALELGVPKVTGYLVDSSETRVSTGNNFFVSAQLQRYIAAEARWEWTEQNSDVRQDGSFGLDLDNAGTYRVRFEPFGNNNFATSFSPEFTVAAGEVSGFSRDFEAITLRPPALSGIVYGPTGSTGVTRAQVVAVDASSGQELWEFSKGTDRNGRWALSLPAGNYNIYARAPYQSITFGDGPLLRNVRVDAAGNATIAGSPAPSPVILRLSEPTWTGTVVDPRDNSITLDSVSICLWQNDGAIFQSRCTNSNSQGEFSLSKWEGFTSFNETSVLTVNPYDDADLSEARFEGKAAIEAVLGAIINGERVDNNPIVLEPALPNVQLTVMAGSAGAANVWVAVFDSQNRWLGGRQTNSSGVANISIPNSNLTGELSFEAYVSSEAFGGAYTTTRKTFAAGSVTLVSGDFVESMDLASPNFLATIYEPGVNASTPGDPAFRSWVEVYNETTMEWLNGSSSDGTGNLSLRLDVPQTGTYEYRLTANPPWPNPKLLSRKTFFAEVDSSGNILLSTTEGDWSNPLVMSGNRFPMLLSAPNVMGKVRMPSSVSDEPVRDSYVVPLDFSTRRELWAYGANSNLLGEFGVTLPDGSYYIYAREPWNDSSVVRSEQCQITVISSAVSGDCVTDGQLDLRLREPNLRFKLVDDSQNPISYAHVSVSYGSWYTWANSGQNGEISLMIDSEEIAAQNPNYSFGNLRFSFYPGPDSSNAVNWNCYPGDAKPVCESLPAFTFGQPYLESQVDLNDVTALGPNTTVKVTLPDNTAVARSWVSLFVHESGYKRWLAGAETRADGLAKFNIEESLINDASKRFSVEVDAPWDQQGSYARANYQQLTYQQLTDASGFSLATPNLVLTIKQKNGTSAASWSSVSVEEVDPNNNNVPVAWVTGFGTNQNGLGAVSLEANKTYRLNVFPGPESQGSRISCLFAVDGVNVVSKVDANCGGNGSVVNKAITMSLSPGNLTGTVYKPGGQVPLRGAIVFAEAFTTGPNPQAVTGMTREAVTDANGQYGLDLDSSYDWQVRVFYVNAPGEITPLASYLTPTAIASADLAAATNNATPIQQSFTLAAK